MERQKSPLDNENKRRRNSAEKSSDASPSERLQKSRSSHLIGSGRNPRDGLGQQVGTDEAAPSRVDRQSETQHDTQNSLEHDINRDLSHNEKELAKSEIREKQAITTTSDGASNHSSTQDINEKRQFSALEEKQFRKWSKSIPLDENGHRVPKTIELTSVSTRDKPILVGGMMGGQRNLWESGETSQSSEADDQRLAANDQRRETDEQRRENEKHRLEAEKCIGKTLGQYRLAEYLGYGGFAYVYRGEHIRSKKRAAVKVLRKDMVNPDNVKKFHKEADVLKKIRHPHIVRGLKSGNKGGVDYLVMEYAPKGTLHDAYNRDAPLPWSPDKVVAMVNDLADALDYLHNYNGDRGDERSLMHLDLKPLNVLLGEYRQLLLSDFGLVKEGQFSINCTGSFQGILGS